MSCNLQFYTLKKIYILFRIKGIEEHMGSMEIESQKGYIYIYIFYTDQIDNPYTRLNNRGYQHQ